MENNEYYIVDGEENRPATLNDVERVIELLNKNNVPLEKEIIETPIEIEKQNNNPTIVVSEEEKFKQQKKAKIKNCQENVIKSDKFLSIAALVFHPVAPIIGLYKIGKTSYEAIKGKDICGNDLNKEDQIGRKYEAVSGATQHILTQVLKTGNIAGEIISTGADFAIDEIKAKEIKELKELEKAKTTKESIDTEDIGVEIPNKPEANLGDVSKRQDVIIEESKQKEDISISAQNETTTTKFSFNPNAINKNIMSIRKKSLENPKVSSKISPPTPFEMQPNY